MARITVEDCLEKVSNRFALIHLAAKRVRQLRKGAEPMISAKNTDNVIALREIAAGKVFVAKTPEQTEPVEEATETEIQTPSEEIKDLEGAPLSHRVENAQRVHYNKNKLPYIWEIPPAASYRDLQSVVPAGEMTEKKTSAEIKTPLALGHRVLSREK